MRCFLATVLLVLATGFTAGCRFSIGHQRLLVRPGVGIPARSFENGDGEMVVCEGMSPEGNSLFVFVGGRLQEHSVKTSRAVTNTALGTKEIKEKK